MSTSPRPTPSPTTAGSSDTDWQRRRDRLARSAIVGEQRLTPEKAHAILAERAQALARVPPQAPAGADVLDVLIFALGNERYALEMDHLREVLRLKDFTPLPGTPEFLLGVTNLRGQILALFDLRKFFGVPSQPPSDSSRIIVMGCDRPEFGVLADAVFEVMRLRSDRVLPAPDSVAGIAREYLRGVTEEALIVLNGAVLIDDRRLIIDQAAKNIEQDKNRT